MFEALIVFFFFLLKSMGQTSLEERRIGCLTSVSLLLRRIHTLNYNRKSFKRSWRKMELKYIKYNSTFNGGHFNHFLKSKIICITVMIMTFRIPQHDLLVIIYNPPNMSSC